MFLVGATRCAIAKLQLILIYCISKAENPGRTVRADIRLDIHEVTDVRVELSVQPRISIVVLLYP